MFLNLLADVHFIDLLNMSIPTGAVTQKPDGECNCKSKARCCRRIDHQLEEIAQKVISEIQGKKATTTP